jgi:hypothetical protein
MSWFDALPDPIREILGQTSLLVVASVIALLLVSFLLFFVVPGGRTWFSLWKANRDLARLRKGTGHSPLNPDRIAAEVMRHRRLAPLWQEFRETLHAQKEVDDSGHERVARWRATALADVFFTDQALVDARVHAEFFRHLPGILTGLGIIGTFFGLIGGLQSFSASGVSNDPLRAQQGLQNLIGAVGHAFYVSALAIGLAMLFTFVEKFLIAAGYRQAARLRETLDACFDVGAGEEYLARLVQASETSATQAAHIKDALVADLKQVLAELTQQQVQATQALALDIPAGLSQSLAVPMQTISDAVRRLGADQGSAVNTLLADVLANFTSQVREVFGGQLTGISDILRDTQSAMQAVLGRFDDVANRLGAAGENAAGAMAQRVETAAAAMETRQQALNQQMGEFVSSLRALLAQSQDETATRMQETLAQLGTQVSGMVEQLRAQAEATATQGRVIHAQVQAHTQTALDGLAQQVDQLREQSAQATEAMRAAVAALTGATADSAQRLQASSEALILAADAFSNASKESQGAMRAGTETARKLREVSESLNTAAASTSRAMAEFRATRDAFAQMVVDLRATVDNARREAGITQTLVESLGAASTKLAAAQTQAERYLESVNEVLATAHQSFADAVTRTLSQANNEFHQHLASATALLHGAIQEMGTVTERIGDEVVRRR